MMKMGSYYADIKVHVTPMLNETCKPLSLFKEALH